MLSNLGILSDKNLIIFYSNQAYNKISSELAIPDLNSDYKLEDL